MLPKESSTSSPTAFPQESTDLHIQAASVLSTTARAGPHIVLASIGTVWLMRLDTTWEHCTRSSWVRARPVDSWTMDRRRTSPREEYGDSTENSLNLRSATDSRRPADSLETATSSQGVCSQSTKAHGAPQRTCREVGLGLPAAQ